MGADRGADASEIAVTADGHKVYGIWISPGVGCRYTGAASGVAVNGQAEGAYMVAGDTQVERWDCNGVGGQKWVQRSDGSLFNPQSGRCPDSPSGATANDTRLQIWDCNGSAAQAFAPG